MRIVFFEIENWEKGFLTERLKGHDVTFHEETLTPETASMAAGADAVSVFIYSKIDETLLAMLPTVKCVTTRSMGYDHVDLAACAAHGVTFSRVPVYGERTVAEHAFGLILALSRKIFLAAERTKKGIFDYRGLQGFDLYKKTLGVVGGGKIGMNSARIAKGFGMDVVVSDPFPRAELAAEIGFAYVPLEELLRRSDVITLHAPYMPTTHHMINGGNVGMIKRGALLVNTARGALVETKALLRALQEGILSGAGLDVLEEELAVIEENKLSDQDLPQKSDLMTVIRDNVLVERNDVIITPHIAFNSREAVERILETTVENLAGFFAGAPVNVVK